MAQTLITSSFRISGAGAVSHEWVASITAGGAATLSQPAASDLSNGVSGSGAVILASSPTLLGTPVIGLASYTTAVANSPALTLAGSYESVITPVYAEDSWTIQDVVGAGLNGTSVLTFAHAGSTGIASVSLPLFVVSGNGAASVSSVSITGTPFTGGNATNTVPLMYLNSGGTVSSWSTAGTVLGINAPSGFTGSLLDLKVNGSATSSLKLSSGGSLTCAGSVISGGAVESISGSYVGWASTSFFTSAASGVIACVNSATTGFSRLTIGPATASFPALSQSSGQLIIQLGDASADTSIRASTFTATGTAAAANVGNLEIGSSVATPSGAGGSAVSTHAAGGGGPAAPQTVVGYIQCYLGTQKIWVPYFE